MKILNSNWLSFMLILACVVALMATPSPLMFEEPPDYIVVYKQDGEVQTKGFQYLDNLLQWLNSPASSHSVWWNKERKYVRLEEYELIAVLDVRTAQELLFRMEVNKQEIQRTEVLQETKWLDKEWLIL